MKHILYLTYDGISDPLGQSQILPYIFGLNKSSKLQFTIISFEKSKNSVKTKELEDELFSNNINWIKLKYRKNPPIISTLYDLFILFLTVKKLIKLPKVDLLHCRSYLTTIIGQKIKNKTGIPFIFDMRGFYADERVDGKIWPQENFLYRKVFKYFKKKEKQFLQESYSNICLTSQGKKEIESWDLSKLSPIHVIPCCTDGELFNIKNRKIKREYIGLKKTDFIISYVGSTGTWYMLDEMLDFFKVLIEKKPSSIFLFVTKDNPNLIFDKCLEKQIPKSSIVIKASSREMMPSYIGLSDFSIFFILPVYSKKASSPTKMGEIMNLGIPIICNSGVGDVDEIMEKTMPNLLVKNFTNEEYTRVSDIILGNFIFDSKKIISISDNYYSLNNGVKKYLDIYQEILK